MAFVELKARDQRKVGNLCAMPRWQQRLIICPEKRGRHSNTSLQHVFAADGRKYRNRLFVVRESTTERGDQNRVVSNFPMKLWRHLPSGLGREEFLHGYFQYFCEILSGER